MKGIRKKYFGVPLSVIVTLAVLSSTALALWLMGIEMSGMITADGGSQPDSVVCSGLDMFITGGATNTTKQCAYDNTDGAVQLVFEVNESITSTDGNCAVQEDDYKFYLSVAGAGYELIPENGNLTKTLGAGNNSLDVMAVQHDNACPASGSWEVTGTLV
jgi:hypothetical protein